MSIFFISIIASNARLAAAPSGSVIASVRAVGVICHDNPHLVDRGGRIIAEWLSFQHSRNYCVTTLSRPINLLEIVIGRYVDQEIARVDPGPRRLLRHRHRDALPSGADAVHL